MAALRRLVPLLAAVAVAVAGLALGAQMQHENALPPDWESQQESNQRVATGNVVALTALLVAGGVTAAVWVLAPSLPRRDWRHGLALFGGAYIATSLLQTAWPFYVNLPGMGQRQAQLSTNLLASNDFTLPSVLVPVFSSWVASVLLALWGARRMLRPGPVRPMSLASLVRRQAGTLLVGAPFLGLAFWGCLKLMVALPPVPGATPHRVVLSLGALAFVGLLVAGAAQAWQLARAARDPRLAPLAVEAWEGIGRAGAGLVGVLCVLTVAGFLMPSFPPEAANCPPCSPLDPNVQYREELEDVAGLLHTGSFGTKIVHVHLALLLFALLPLAPMVQIHRQGLRLLDSPPSQWQTRGRQSVILGAGIVISLFLGGAATWFIPGAIWAWAAATFPIALAAIAVAGPVREAQATLLAGFTLWCLGNSLEARFDASTLGQVEFETAPSMLAIWRLLGSLAAAWAATRLLRARAEPPARASRVIPLAAATGVAVLVVFLLELPLDIWTQFLTAGGTTHNASVIVGTGVARMDSPAAWTVHGVCLLLSMVAAIMAAKLLRPDWFRRGGAAIPVVRPALTTT